MVLCHAGSKQVTIGGFCLQNGGYGGGGGGGQGNGQNGGMLLMLIVWPWHLVMIVQVSEQGGVSSFSLGLKGRVAHLTMSPYEVHACANVGGGGGAGYVGGAGDAANTVPGGAFAGSSFLSSSISGTCAGLTGNSGNGYVSISLPSTRKR